MSATVDADASGPGRFRGQSGSYRRGYGSRGSRDSFQRHFENLYSGNMSSGVYSTWPTVWSESWTKRFYTWSRCSCGTGRGGSGEAQLGNKVQGVKGHSPDKLEAYSSSTVFRLFLWLVFDCF